MSPALVWIGMAAAVIGLGSAPAAAELGGPLSSVAVDKGRMGARLASTSMGRYARHELTRPNSGMVREFTNAAGTVFAVTWSGPGKPDLRSLLGGYFTTFQGSSAASGRAMHSLRRPAAVSTSDLQVQSAGHMGWFRGVAFVPSLAPAGFDASTLAPQP